MTELKPCPFCGKPVAMDIIPGADVGSEEYYAGCGCLSNEAGAYGVESDGDSEESVAAMWNHRPLEAALEARVKELEAELAEAQAAAVQWVTYTGEPETLPKMCGDYVLVRHSKSPKTETSCLHRVTPDTYGWYAAGSRQYVIAKPGDRWAYLPAPPEASE